MTREEWAAQLPAYVAKMAAAVQAHGVPPGTVQVVEVLHDDGCARPDGGPCTCNPDVRIVTREGA